MDWISAAQWLDEAGEIAMPGFGRDAPRGAQHGKRNLAREQIKLNLLAETVDALRLECQARGVPFMTFTAKLIDVIADEKMFDAVLDGEMPRIKEGV